MELNRIGNVTTWNDAAEKLNENFAKIDLELSNIEGGQAFILSNWEDYTPDKANTHAVGAGLGYQMASNLPIKKVGRHWWIYSARLNTYIDSGVTTGAGNGVIVYISAPDSGEAIFQHNLNTYPSVTCIDHTEIIKKEVECSIDYISEKEISVKWNGTFNGFVYVI